MRRTTESEQASDYVVAQLHRTVRRLRRADPQLTPADAADQALEHLKSSLTLVLGSRGGGAADIEQQFRYLRQAAFPGLDDRDAFNRQPPFAPEADDTRAALPAGYIDVMRLSEICRMLAQQLLPVVGELTDAESCRLLLALQLGFYEMLAVAMLPPETTGDRDNTQAPPGD